MYCLVELKKENKLDFKRFVRPFFEGQFEKLDEDQSVCGAGATFFGDPVGLALCHNYYENNWNVIIVYVVPKFRNMGIGTALMTNVEAMVSQRDGRKMLFSYQSDNTTRLPVEKVLARRGFPEPLPEVNFYRTEIEKLCDLGWIKKYVLAEALEKSTVFYREYEIFRWAELNDRDRDMLLASRGSIYSRDVSPLEMAEKIDGQLSLGVRHNGDLIGWLVTMKSGDDNLYIKASFLKEEYRGTSLYVVLFSTIMNLQKKAGIPYTTTEVRTDNKRMIRFMNHALADAGYTRTESLSTLKNLAPTL
ncbi:MAG: hypothetical protein JL50_09885 [Peptococcaceae bacterium BICA1-7]|nr:MAG: hypothetical protein JL50_09885 [Peptococcaceae bacterium BICA1-7]